MDILKRYGQAIQLLSTVFFYKIFTFHCPCLTADHIETSVLGEIIHFVYWFNDKKCVFIIYDSYSDTFKENYNRRSPSMSDCRSGRYIWVLGQTMQ